jgi:hypothetical protein
MDIHGYMDNQRVWIWSAIHAHEYFCGRGTMRLMDLDLILQYPSKPAPLTSLIAVAQLYFFLEGVEENHGPGRGP